MCNRCSGIQRSGAVKVVWGNINAKTGDRTGNISQQLVGGEYFPLFYMNNKSKFMCAGATKKVTSNFKIKNRICVFFKKKQTNQTKAKLTKARLRNFGGQEPIPEKTKFGCMIKNTLINENVFRSLFNVTSPRRNSGPFSKRQV